MFKPVFFVAIAGLVACGGEEPPMSGQELTSPIYYGSPESGYPAVARMNNGGSWCTATLVGKRTVLTAAHCIKPGNTHTIVFSNQSYTALKTVQHPTEDIGVLLLKDAPPVKPALISASPPSVGQKMTLVGFGKTETGSSGEKRSGTNTVASLTDTIITIQSPAKTKTNLCHGDSGGPSFALINGQEVQVGVHRSVLLNTCGLYSMDGRVDKVVDWIKTSAGGDVAVGGKPPAVDKEPPRAAITRPAPGATLVGEVTFEATVTDNVAVDRVELKIDGAAGILLSGAPYRRQLTLAPGKHTLELTAADKAGNTARSVVMVSVLAAADEASSGGCSVASAAAPQGLLILALLGLGLYRVNRNRSACAREERLRHDRAG